MVTFTALIYAEILMISIHTTTQVVTYYQAVVILDISIHTTTQVVTLYHL